MFVYFFPAVILLAYFFQDRVARLRLDLELPDDTRGVRVARATLHSLFVLTAGVFAPYGAGAIMMAIVDLRRGASIEHASLPLLPFGGYVVVAMLVLFVVFVGTADKVVDALLAAHVARSRSALVKRLPVRDLLRFELPDVAFLFGLACLASTC